jgi:type-F conjugative transfer system pilin assembly protein TrbC
MRHGWLVGPILSFSLFVILGTSLGESPSGGFQDLSPDDIKKIEEIAGKFQKPFPEKTYTPLIERSEEICDPGHFEDAVKNFYPDLDTEIIKGSSKTAESIPSIRIRKGDTWYYLFSFSMPKDSIKNALKEAAQIRTEGIPVAMVLRGFVDNNFKTTVIKVYALLRELKIDVPFEINPELFDQAAVETVPALTKTGAGILRGDVGLRWAMEKLKQEPGDQGKWGNSYEIGEEDIIKYIGSNQAMIEAKLRERIDEIKEKMYVPQKYYDKYRDRFPRVEKESVYEVDPIYTLQEDIRDQNGNIVLKKGTKTNPSDYATLGRYVIIDGNDPKQVEFAIGGNFRKIILVAGDLVKLTAEYRQRFYFVNDQIIDLVKLKRVPIVFEQEGTHVKVTEKKL